MSIEHDGRPLTRLIVGLEKYLIELTAGSLLFFVDLLKLLSHSSATYLASNVRIFLCTENSKELRCNINFDQFFMTNGLEKLTDILITTSIAINLHQATPSSLHTAITWFNIAHQ